MENLIIVGILMLIVGGAVFYLVGEKKKGVKCIGCPYAKQCGKKCGNAGKRCSGDTEDQKNRIT